MSKPDIDTPTIEWLIDEICPNEGNSPLLNFNKQCLLKLIQEENIKSRLDELRNAPHDFVALVNRIDELEARLKEESKYE